MREIAYDYDLLYNEEFCDIKDFQKLKLTPDLSREIEEELALWHDFYLPIKQEAVVLDVGAGCGETAKLYLNHGARKVIAIEKDDTAYKLLCENFKGDDRVVPIHAGIDNIKIDIEGAEEGLAMEVHFPFRLKKFRAGFDAKGNEVVLLRLERNNGITGKIANLCNMGILAFRKLVQGDLTYKK